MESVHLSFTYTEEEYLAAARLFLWKSKETLARLLITYLFIASSLVLLFFLVDLSLPLWFTITMIVLAGIGLYHGFVIDLPRRYFRGDPKFRDEYNLTFLDEGIRFKTTSIDASIAWSLYTGIIENERFYLLIYGKNIASMSILPKRAFRDPRQEEVLRQMLQRHIDQKFSLSTTASIDTGENEYKPSSLEPPDWR